MPGLSLDDGTPLLIQGFLRPDQPGDLFKIFPVVTDEFYHTVILHVKLNGREMAAEVDVVKPHIRI